MPSATAISLRKVDSSNTHSVGHDPVANELHVKYHVSGCPAQRGGDCACAGGETYIYESVSAQKHEALLAAESIGKFVNSQIKGRHQHRKA